VKPNFETVKRWVAAHRRPGLSLGLAVAFIIILLWFLGNVLSPFLIPAGTLDLGNEGTVGPMDNESQISEIENGFARFFYKMGDANCHQRDSRSFFLNGNQMPFCARCTSIFLGLAIGVFIMIFLEIELNILWIITGLIPVGIDGSVQMLTDYESSNPVRFSTGLLAGIVTGIALGFIISEFGHILVMRRKKKELMKKESQ
jgi:uncharacterized membrane protein